MAPPLTYEQWLAQNGLQDTPQNQAGWAAINLPQAEPPATGAYGYGSAGGGGRYRPPTPPAPVGFQTPAHWG